MPEEPSAPAQRDDEVVEKQARWRRLVFELIRFGSVGGAAYVIDVGLYNLLVFGPGELLGAKPVTAKVISVAVATLFSWIGNRFWAFRDHRQTKTPVRELVMFIIVNLIGMAIAAGCLYFSRWVLNLHTPLADNISGNLIGTGLGTIFRYLCYRYIVFSGDEQPPLVKKALAAGRRVTGRAEKPAGD